MQEYSGDHEVGGPVMYRPNDVPKWELGHDELHAMVSGRRVTFTPRDVVESKNRAADYEDDEG
jgi:hypothetical protein